MDQWLPTRMTLIERLKDWQDQASWQQFFDTYWKVIHSFALRSGLDETEAMDVVQDTLISVAKHLRAFDYDPARGSFKNWLLKMAQWRIRDQFRRRGLSKRFRRKSRDTQAGTDTVERIPAPTAEMWDSDWERNLLDAALTNVKRRVDPQTFQVFDLYVQKDCPPAKIAELFGISVGQVYLAKHRITSMVKDEVQRLQKDLV
jgi:RNA polymerase sigma factor (sigma-70 family)